jgi:hypothetical protein
MIAEKNSILGTNKWRIRGRGKEEAARFSTEKLQTALSESGVSRPQEPY